MLGTGIYYDERMNLHKSFTEEKHNESSDRIKVPFLRLQKTGLLARMIEIKPRSCTIDEMQLIHSKSYTETLQKTNGYANEGLAQFAALNFVDVFICSHSYLAASIACGGAIASCEAVWLNQVDNALALVRPPGHHATHNAAMGFCLLNNVGIAAEYMLMNYSLKKILIVDWDVHHGNGTQNAFYNNPNVLVISIHRFDQGEFFPYQEDADYTFIGDGPGIGRNVNIPWEGHGKTDADYIYAFTNIVMPVAMEFNPDLVIVSAGFDAGAKDPLGECHVTPDCFAQMTHMLMGLAQGKVVLVLEGGYNASTISDCVYKCTRALLKLPLDAYKPVKLISPGVSELINNVKQVLAPYYKCLRPYDIVKDNFIPFIDLIEGYFSSILSRQYRLTPIRNDDFLVHSSPNLADRGGFCYLILQNLSSSKLVYHQHSPLDQYQPGIQDSVTPLIDLIHRNNHTIYHIGLSHYNPDNPAELWKAMLSLGAIQAKGIFIIILDLPSIILEPVLVNLDTQFHKVLQAFVITSEHDPEVIRNIVPQRKHWLIERCIIYEPSKDKFNQTISMTKNDSDSDLSNSTNAEAEITRMSYGSLGPVEASHIIKISPIIFDLCVKRQTGASLGTSKKSRKLRGGRIGGQSLTEPTATRWNDIGEDEDISNDNLDQQVKEVEKYLEHAKKYRKMLEDPSLQEPVYNGKNTISESSSDEEEEILQVGTGRANMDIAFT